MYSPRSASPRTRAFAVAACLALVAVACGDDDEEPTAAGDETTTTEATEGEESEYCRLAKELDESEEMPGIEQFEALREAAPAEISEEVNLVVDAIVAADGDLGKAFGDPAVEENIGVIEEYEADACGLGGDDEEGEGEEEPETEPIEGAQVVPVAGVDYAFEGIPAEIAAGPTSFEFTNEGEAAHEMFIARLGEGVVLDELLASDEEPTDEQAQDIGGTFSEPGGDVTYVNVENLEPGTYAVLCFIPGPEGKPHFELGMKTTFTVA